MEITLRSAELEDSGLIAEMLYQLAADIGDADIYRGNQEAIAQYGFGPERRFYCLIAEADHSATGLAAGFALYFPTFSTTRGEPGIYLQDLWVAESARGKGVANKLIQATSRLGSEEFGATHLTLTVYNDNPSAMKFYQSMGFHLGDREKHAALDGALFQELITSC